MERLVCALRRAEAVLLAALTLWITAVTAGSGNLRSAAEALDEALPQSILRWQLGDVGREETLSPAAAMALRASALLFSAREQVAALPPAKETDASPPPEAAPPSGEAAPETATPQDNGVPARTLVPVSPAGYTVLGRAYISNSTDHDLSLWGLGDPFDAALGEGDGPQILILHTHGSEAYTPAEDPGIVWSGRWRTTDCRYNVVAVGDALAQALGEAGFGVLHDRTLYDYPSYDCAYDRSLAAIERHIARYPSIRLVLDVHRDAVEDGTGQQYKVVWDEGGPPAAQMTLVVGSDGSGLPHPRWSENLKLAAALQEQLLAEHPTLMRPILLRDSRYNQHVTTGSLLVEVGAAGNSPEEALAAAELLAQALAELLAGKEA